MTCMWFATDTLGGQEQSGPAPSSQTVRGLQKNPLEVPPMSTDSTTNGIKAIETRYAGCHFRSRLEARWAVFFDALGIRWEYEPQGYEISTGLDGRPEIFRYLPDFHLPDLNQLVEVKGSWTATELERTCVAVCPHGTSIGGSLLLLGPVPRVNPDDSVAPHHALLGWHKGDVTVDWVAFNMGWSSNSPGPYGKPSMLDSWQDDEPVWCDSYTLTDQDPDYFITAQDASVTWILGARDIEQPRNAYTAARSARFEHGQSGAS